MSAIGPMSYQNLRPARSGTLRRDPKLKPAPSAGTGAVAGEVAANLHLQHELGVATTEHPTTAVEPKLPGPWMGWNGPMAPVKNQGGLLGSRIFGTASAVDGMAAPGGEEGCSDSKRATLEERAHVVATRLSFAAFVLGLSSYVWNSTSLAVRATRSAWSRRRSVYPWSTPFRPEGVLAAGRLIQTT